MNEGAGVGFGDEDREADRLFGVFGGIVYRPVGPPRGEENAVREDNYTSITRCPRSTRFSWDKLHTGTETFHRFAEGHVAPHIAMTGAERVAGGEVNRSTRSIRNILNIWGWQPIFYGDLYGRFVMGLRDDALRALGDGFDMHHLPAVPVFDRTDAYSARDAEDVIAVACG